METVARTKSHRVHLVSWDLSKVFQCYNYFDVFVIFYVLQRHEKAESDQDIEWLGFEQIILVRISDCTWV